MNKWQEREVAQYAKDNDVSEDAAREALHPAPARRKPAAPKEPAK